MNTKLLKYILFGLVMVISIVLLLNIVKQNSYNENNENNENSYNSIDLSFIDENVGWAVQSNGYASDIVKTTDGGENWLNISSYKGNIIKIFFLDTLDGWAITQSNTSNAIKYAFLKTEDGGKTFKVKYKKTFKSISLIQMKHQTTELIFFDKNNGYAMLSGKLLKTTDGGQKWSTITPNIPDFFVTEMCFINVDFGWVGGSVSIDKNVNGDAYDAHIYCTTDGGNKWLEQFRVSSINGYQKTHDYQINGISFIDNKYG